jgi:methionyl-tRNA formyltransferase
MKIVFMGTPQAAVPTIARLVSDGHRIVAVYTQPDRPSGRGNKVVFSPVKQFAIEHDLPVSQPTKIRTDEMLETFRSHDADVVVVVAYGRILPPSFLTAFQHGAINVHFSMLPKYRGAAPVNWAIANGEDRTGVTTMKMDEGLDTGPVLLQKSVEIRSEETAIELMHRLSDIGAELLSETLANIEKIEPKPQNDELASYAPIMKRDDGRIDWSMKASEIADRIRGFQPFPGSFTHLDSTKITIWRAIATGEVTLAQPGDIFEAKADRLSVACGDRTLLQITEIQPEGKRRMSIRDFLNGAKVANGSRFESS